jgi:hypothetical protein
MVLPRIIGAGVILAVCTSFSLGQDSSSFKLTAKGQSWAEAGQVVKGYDKNAGDINNVYFQRIYLLPGLDVRFSERTTFTGSGGIKAFNEFPRLVKLGGTRRHYYYLFLDYAELRHNMCSGNNLQLDIGGGYFHYKYNEESRNLGEYLFRSTAYPQTIANEFDFPKARLAGLYSRNSYISGKNKISLDVLAFTNTEWVAIGDLNIALVASYNYAKAIEIGAGVAFGSVFSADEKTTTPTNSSTRYIKNQTDTSNCYTFRGTKVMGRLTFDIKNALSLPDVFGKEDLKLYSEAALLGVKNYGVALYSPIWYNSRLERIPVMVGFNLPAFKFLDVLSLEGEWWGNRYPNSMQGIVENGVPLPFVEGTSSVDSTMYKNDNYKWSLFASKTFKTHYRVAFQAASDHMRTFAWDWNRQDWEESLRSPDKWYFVLKFGILF